MTEFEGRKLRDVRACLACGEGVARGGKEIAFYEVSIQQFVLLPGAIRRHGGLATMLGSTALAEVMGPDEDIAQAPSPPMRFWVCQPCAVGEQSLLALWGRQGEEEARDGPTGSAADDG